MNAPSLSPTTPTRETPAFTPGRTRSRLLQRKCACGGAAKSAGECEECRKKRLLRKPNRAESGVPAGSLAPSIVHDVISSPGQPLDPSTRSLMEPRFGHDFSQVRVHTDTRAGESADAVDASAYAVGRNIVFAAGQYRPSTEQGLSLLAHELTHVTQQAGSHFAGGSPIEIDPNSSLEREAQNAGASPFHSQGFSARPGLQRAPAPGGGSVPPGSLVMVDPSAIPPIWRATPLPLSGGQDVFVYRGFASDATARLASVLREGDIGGVLSRRLDAANDAVFNQVNRDPVMSGPSKAGVVRLRIPADVWDELVRTNSISERGNYPGFSHGLDTTEIRVNSPEAVRVINAVPKDVLPPDPYYDFRGIAPRPSRPQAPPENAPATEPPENVPSSERPTVPPPAKQTGAPENAPATPAAPAELPVKVEFRVVNSTRQSNGNMLSEVEAVLGDGLEHVNKTSMANGGPSLPARILLRITTDPKGALVAAESPTAEAAAMVETLAQRAEATLPRAAAGASGGAVAGSAWVRGLGWAGLVVFVGVTAYHYQKAVPELRPRVLTTAGGGFAGGALYSYLICNAVLGIETVGWSLLICALPVGFAGSMIGSGAAGDFYDENIATPLQRGLQGLESQPANVRSLFYAMVQSATASQGGLPVTAEFVRQFLMSVPPDLADDELAALVGQMRAVAGTSTLDGVLRSLRAAIGSLPRRRALLLPPNLNLPNVGPGGINGQFRLDAPGGSGRIQLLPPDRPPDGSQPPDGRSPGTKTLLEINL